MKRRLLLGLSASAGLGLFATLIQTGDATPRPRGFFFAPSDDPTRDVEAALHRALPGWDVTVFGKARDLETAIEQWGSDAVIAPEATLNSLGLNTNLQGRLNGSTSEPYVLVSIGAPLSPGQLEGQTVGMLGLMGRREMKDLCNQILGVSGARLKTVTKYRDLLPLLQFRAAKAVLLPKRFVGVLTERSELELKATELPKARVGVCCASLRNPKHESAFRAMSSQALAKLGVDGWA